VGFVFSDIFSYSTENESQENDMVTGRSVSENWSGGMALSQIVSQVFPV
jgi:hypothetical protein